MQHCSVSDVNRQAVQHYLAHGKISSNWAKSISRFELHDPAVLLRFSRKSFSSKACFRSTASSEDCKSMYETLDQLVRGVIKPSDLSPSQVFRQHDKHDQASQDMTRVDFTAAYQQKKKAKSLAAEWGWKAQTWSQGCEPPVRKKQECMMTPPSSAWQRRAKHCASRWKS